MITLIIILSILVYAVTIEEFITAFRKGDTDKVLYAICYTCLLIVGV